MRQARTSDLVLMLVLYVALGGLALAVVVTTNRSWGRRNRRASPLFAVTTLAGCRRWAASTATSATTPLALQNRAALARDITSTARYVHEIYEYCLAPCLSSGADRDRVIRSGQKHADQVRGLALDVLQQTADPGQVEEDLNRELEVLMAGRFTLQVEQRESDEQAEEKTPRVLLVGTALVCLAVLITVAVLDHRGWHVPALRQSWRLPARSAL